MASYPALQYLTWVLQVMPIFFAFGGAASVIAWRKADAGDVLYSTWMWGRVRRLLRPVLVYLAIMAVFSAVRDGRGRVRRSIPCSRSSTARCGSSGYTR